MKILMVSEDLPGAQIGGLGKHVVTLSNALLARGHEVAILGRNDDGLEGCAEQIGFGGRFIAAFDYDHPGWKELQLGVFNPLKRPWFARKIARAIARHARPFHVVHYHGHLPMVGLHVDAAVNFVQTRHDQGSECLTHLRFRGDAVCDSVAPRDCAGCIRAHAGPLRQSVSALAVNRYRGQSAAAFAARKTVFVSEFLRRQFQRAVPHADLARSAVLHNFVDADRLARAAAERGADPEPGAILLVGRVDAGKGFGEFLAEAAPRLPAGVRVTIAGDGPQRAHLERAHGGARVQFPGWLDYADVIRRAARSHLCVVPSVCEEACSTTVLEALALGRQCVALARGGTPELLRYQGWDGQLRLAGTMRELVDITLALATRAPVRAAPAAPFGADAARALPTLLELYAQRT
ncbi:MAG: glycosyltransferase family 4 protein [Pseudomonadota bacterium]|nr:glycosyltransferase family 4 protein [Pseudomonadota bacterium]